MRLRIIQVTCAFTALAALAAAEPAHVVLHNAVVERQPEHPSTVSGTAAVCVRIDIRTEKGERFPVYEIYLSDKQTLPQPSAGCTVEYHTVKQTTCGVVAGKPPKDERPNGTIRLLDRLSCTITQL